jgi:hypothetical protein
MTPCNSIPDVVDRGRGNSVLDRNGVARLPAFYGCVDSARLFRCEFTRRSSLLRLVGHIIGMITDKEMHRSNAQRFIAGVKYVYSHGDVSEREFVGHAVGEYQSSLDSKSSISTGALLASPNNAARSGYGCDLSIESSGHRSEISCSGSAVPCLHSPSIPPTTGGTQWLN